VHFDCSVMGAFLEPPGISAPARRKRRTISPEGKRRIIEAQRKRWAEWRAARAKAQKAQQK